MQNFFNAVKIFKRQCFKTNGKFRTRIVRFLFFNDTCNKKKKERESITYEKIPKFNKLNGNAIKLL